VSNELENIWNDTFVVGLCSTVATYASRCWRLYWKSSVTHLDKGYPDYKIGWVSTCL